MTRKIARN